VICDLGWSGDGKFVEEFLNDGFAGFIFGFGFVGDGDAMAEDIHADAFDILGGDVAASLEKSVGFGSEGEGDRCAGGCAELDKIFDVDLVVFGGSGGADEVDDIILYLVVDVDVVDDFSGCEDVFWSDDGAGGGEVTGSGHEIEDLAFFASGGVTDLEFEHEAIDLGFGEGVGAFLFDGVLGGEDEERFLEGEGLFADGDLFFLHGFEEGALDFGGGTVDFVGKDEISEDGAFAGGEPAGLRVIDLSADDVGGQHVWGELEPGEFDADTVGEGFDGECFGESGDAFKEDMAVGEQADDEALDEVTLPDDDLADFGEEGADESASALNFFVDCSNSSFHVRGVFVPGEGDNLKAELERALCTPR